MPKSAAPKYAACRQYDNVVRERQQRHQLLFRSFAFREYEERRIGHIAVGGTQRDLCGE
jgi:hypothetical protein